MRRTESCHAIGGGSLQGRHTVLPKAGSSTTPVSSAQRLRPRVYCLISRQRHRGKPVGVVLRYSNRGRATSDMGQRPRSRAAVRGSAMPQKADQPLPQSIISSGPSTDIRATPERPARSCAVEQFMPSDGSLASGIDGASHPDLLSREEERDSGTVSYS